MKPSFAIVGCGRVGSALAKYLAEAGYIPAGLASIINIISWSGQIIEFGLKCAGMTPASPYRVER